MQQMWFHTIAMFATSFITLWSADLPSWSYVATAGLAIFFGFSMRGLGGEEQERAALRVFHGSITYLSLYSILLVVAVLI